MILNNPYVKELHLITKELDRCKDKVQGIELRNQLSSLQSRSRQYIDKALDHLGQKVVQVKQKVIEHDDTKPITVQYKDAINLYREADALVKECRQLKKVIRDEMQQKRVKRK